MFTIRLKAVVAGLLAVAVVTPCAVGSLPRPVGSAAGRGDAAGGTWWSLLSAGEGPEYGQARRTPEPGRWGASRSSLDTTTVAEIRPSRDGWSLVISGLAQAGSSATHFVIASSNLSFPTILNPPARTDVQFIIADANNDGATLTGSGPGGYAYRALYNNTQVFAQLVQGGSAPPGGQAIIFEEHPVGGGYETIPGPVNSIRFELDFVLSAYDTALYSAHFTVLPEPATSVLLAAAGLGLLRRRR